MLSVEELPEWLIKNSKLRPEGTQILKANQVDGGKITTMTSFDFSAMGIHVYSGMALEHCIKKHTQYLVDSELQEILDLCF